jgi:predicted acyl esterase
MPSRPFLSHDHVEKVRPGDAVPVETEALPSSTLFEPGETLRLVPSGRAIVAHARFGHDDTVNQGDHGVHAGGSRPPSLLIPFC